MKTISIILNLTKSKTSEISNKLINILNKYDLNILIDKIEPTTSLIFTIGGDGTMVRALKNYSNIPTVGINAGTLGFLTEINEDNMEECINRILKKDYIIENCISLNCELIRDNNVIFNGKSINDIVISRSNAFQMVRFDVLINDKQMKQYNADGFIISTPLGASAYALSCGGPLIEPTSNLIELTPIAPHTLINRSIVIDDTKEVKVIITDIRDNNKNTLLSVDGETPIELMPNDIIKVAKSEHNVSLLRLNNDSFIDNLAKKMYRI